MSVSGIIKEALSPYLTGVHPGVNTQADSPIIADGFRAPTAPNPTPAQPETLAEAFAKTLDPSSGSSRRRFTDKPSSFGPFLPQRLPENRLVDAVRKAGEPPKPTKKFTDRLPNGWK